MSSVRDIASEAGVSTATVSRVLNNDPSVAEKTRDKVLAVANQLGYVPSVGRRVTTNIGFAYTQDMTVDHPFDAAVLKGISRALGEYEYDLLLLNLQRDKQARESFTQFMMRKGVRGVFLRTMITPSRGYCRKIAEEGFPHVVICERFDSPDINYIDSDSKSDSIRVMEYLIGLGHKRIAFAMHNVPNRDHQDRFEGYKEALKNNEIPLDETLVFRYPFTLAGGASVVNVAMSRPSKKPTAIFFADAALTMGALKRAQEMGIRIPEDLSIIGFDDSDLRHSVHPSVTSICRDAEALGFEAAQWLAQTLDGNRKEPLRRTIPTFFEVNNSAAPPRADAD